MHHDKPSATAWAVALRRAAHQLIDQPLVLEDPLAVPLVGRQAVEEAIAKTAAAGATYQAYATAIRALVVGRSRWAEDALAAAVAAGARQYVVLGAGLDTFGHRNLHETAGLRVWEVDHPATQAWKRELLAKAGVASPTSLTFVPVDFERETLEERLAVAGYVMEAPTFFSWLGVVPYLTLEAFRQTITFLGKRPAGSAVVFDYASGLAELSPRERLAFDMLSRRVQAAGEPFRLFVPAEQMHAELMSAGFTRVEDWDAEAMNARYFADRTDGLRVAGRLGHFVQARN